MSYVVYGPITYYHGGRDKRKHQNQREGKQRHLQLNLEKPRFTTELQKPLLYIAVEDQEFQKLLKGGYVKDVTTNIYSSLLSRPPLLKFNYEQAIFIQDPFKIRPRRRVGLLPLDFSENQKSIINRRHAVFTQM